MRCTEIRRALPDVVLIGNGDALKFEDFQRLKDYAGVDAVMAGSAFGDNHMCTHTHSLSLSRSLS